MRRAAEDTLLETLNALVISQVELESRTGINKKTINRVIKGKEPITQETALAFEKVLKVPAHFWLNMDNRYRQHLAREADAATMSAHVNWGKLFPYAQMVKAGFVPAAATASSKVAALLEYFCVSQPDGWQQMYGGMKSELYPTARPRRQRISSEPSPLGCVRARSNPMPRRVQNLMKAHF